MQNETENMPVICAGALRKYAKSSRDCRRVIVADGTVAKLYLESLLPLLNGENHVCLIPPGEQSKSFVGLDKVLTCFAHNKLGRDGEVVAFGGGVIGDLVGFAASVWMRGVSLVQLPTTLLAMVDSSVGGKTAIDLPCGKNLIGSFYEPTAVFADTDLLKTLAHEYIMDGGAELLKAAIIGDEKLFTHLCENQFDLSSEESIRAAVAVKWGIVSRDRCEKGERRLLNLGHTVGHAIECVSNYNIRHGLAVAIGMRAIADVGLYMGVTSENCRNRIVSALETLGFNTRFPFTVEELADAIKLDKKCTGYDKINVVLPVEIGQCKQVELTLDELYKLLLQYEKSLA